MPDAAPSVLTLTAPFHIFRSKGANRIRYQSASRISEGFDKDAAPTVGAICIAVHESSEDEEDGAVGDSIVALALVRGVAGVASGLVRATLTPIYRLPAAVPVADLQRKPVALGKIPPDFHSRLLSAETAQALVKHLEAFDPTLREWIAAVLGDAREFPEGVQQSRVEAKDAVQLAAQMANIELPADAFVSPPSESANETLLQTVLNAGYEHDLEEELLPLDLQRFDGKLVGDQRAASVAVFIDKNGGDKLMVMSVNKKPIELELGVDLLYWDQVHDAFTFVQYKRLEKFKSNDPHNGHEWAYARKGEITKQLALMPMGRQVAKLAADWRAFGTPFWFKFVRGDAGRKLDNKTLKGMYVPADWLRLAVEEDTFKVGPRGGFRLTYDNAKYVDRTTFAQLVSRGFVGTAGARSKAFKKLLQSKDRELIVAVRTEWQDDEDPELNDLSPEADGVARAVGFSNLPF
ncbi:hypothetical protein [Microterricola pindariensis]|uniref:Uncharacterized protein n=1 Tax=Microterricola pindariensis TaxID=478010 RepID=A0ABX5AY39_9MICO|nr:hypothetical protein [Microterricola pindariensis]PPL19812.1 hypothetical protein GY24_04130 [Microterricola pindariensis]